MNEPRVKINGYNGGGKATGKDIKAKFLKYIRNANDCAFKNRKNR